MIIILTPVFSTIHIRLDYIIRSLSNTLYVNKQEQNIFRGCKQMNYEAQTTLMVCTADNSYKVTLDDVGK